MNVSSLPPMPDRQTGEPRPPRAPLDLSWGYPEAKDREHDRGRMPAAPEGQGPVLEWFQDTNLNSVMAGVLLSLIIIGFMTLKARGFDWMGVWWLWLFVVPYPFIFFIVGRRERMAAGADWFEHNGSWVKTYELVSVRVLKAWASPDLELNDADGRKTSISLTDIQKNLELWDLVYNGILHSVCTGQASTNQLARERLHLPEGRTGADEHPGRPGETRSTSRPLAMSRASRIVHTVLACVFVVAGILALGIAGVGLSSSDIRGSASGIGGMIFLVVVGAGFVAVFVWLLRRIER